MGYGKGCARARCGEEANFFWVFVDFGKVSVVDDDQAVPASEPRRAKLISVAVTSWWRPTS